MSAIEQNFLEREGSKLPKPPAEGQPDKRVWHFYYYDDPESQLRQILASTCKGDMALAANRLREAHDFVDRERLIRGDEPQHSQRDLIRWAILCLAVVGLAFMIFIV